MMRFRRSGAPGPQIPVIPLVSLALIVGTCVAVSALTSTSRGPGLRFASVGRDGGLDDTNAVRVEVSSEQDAAVDGTPVPFERLADELSARLEGRPDPVVVLVVSPEVSYERMVEAYGAIAELPGSPRVAFPSLGRGPRG